METQLYKTLLLGLYQLSLVVGIVLFPLAMVTQQFGVRLPIDRVVGRLGVAYERASA